MSLERFYCDLVAVERVTRATDGIGGARETWAARTGLSATPARVTTVSAERRTTNAGIEPIYTHEVMLGALEIDETQDRIKWGTRVLVIVAVKPARGASGAVHHLTLQCKEKR